MGTISLAWDNLWGTLRTWGTLSWAERRLFLRAWFLLPLVVAGLRLLGLRRLQAALLDDLRPPSRHDLPAAHNTARLVHAATCWNPIPATCLARSLLLCRLLRDQSLAAELQIGVTRNDGHFAAHAWVEHRGLPLNDSQDVALRYAPFDRVWLEEGSTR